MCTKGLKLYTHAGYDRNALLKIEAAAQAAERSNTPFAKAYVPEPDDPDFYVLMEPGDVCDSPTRTALQTCTCHTNANCALPQDKFDVPEGYGTCTDTNIAFGHTGCMDSNGAKFSLAVTGCFGRAFVRQWPSNHLGPHHP